MIYITPTPIGNLDDITIRAFKVLSKAKVIFCEDGKITSKLLNLLNIQNKPKYINLVRANRFNEAGAIIALSEIYKNLDEKKTEFPVLVHNQIDLETDDNVIAIVTDAGTPGISDPAFEILQLIQQLKLDYTVLPGATACIPAIVSSNFVSKEFMFLGFLPIKKGRQRMWAEILVSKYPVVLYESCHRITKLINEMKTNLDPNAQISISQEISKKNENTWIGTIDQLPYYNLIQKGEFVIVIRN